MSLAKAIFYNTVFLILQLKLEAIEKAWDFSGN